METPNWHKISVKAERVVIIGSGPSMANVPIDTIDRLCDEGIHVIAVNGAIRFLNKTTSWFTLDPDERLIGLMKRQRHGTEYYAAVPKDYGSLNAKVAYHRRTIIEGIHYLHRLTGGGPMKSKEKLSDNPYEIHTGNSAWGALGLAYLMEPKKIIMLGVDGTNKRYAYIRQYPKMNFQHLPWLFSTCVEQLKDKGIELINGSEFSRIDCFKRVKPETAIGWIRK